MPKKRNDNSDQSSKTVTIPLRSHEQIVAALHLTDLIGRDSVAVVMVKGYGEDWRHWTGIYLADYDAEMLADDTLFADYKRPELWVTPPILEANK